MSEASDFLNRENPFDKTSDWDFLYTTTGNHPGLSVYKCKDREWQAIYPRPPQKELYSEAYYKGKSEYSYIDERETEKYQSYVWDARIKNIRKFISKGHFLDIGSSFGGFLKRAQLKGFTVQGVEISDYAAGYANENGVPTFHGTFLEANFPDHSFDVITLIEVIEHLENPKLIFREITRILKPNGLLVLQTANFEGWQAKKEKANYHYYMPGHVYYYSDSVMKEILTRLKYDRFISYFGVDFPLSAKLLKSRGSFKSIWDYAKWIRIAFYHFQSKLKKNGFPLTSSYVLYAFRSR
ncbi:class I SAM-dependent methyltransferase [Leptospira ilyithenensis]|uniref:Class I SAM-dependent methyltransferase n=1 Tax=Leptospira ilyithenensis TaxID=2484901 RepID=A0A4R9LRU0_9LEPT|nr:class I SAM-dependent methyltransferase [Leptospira ilyithenensis]TGN13980.1 class I SAM-dependent methyltransferase [Leptospira ilyithenensis]